MTTRTHPTRAVAPRAPAGPAQTSYSLAQEYWESALGPREGSGPLGRDASLHRHEMEAFPHDALSFLAGLGMARRQIPTAHGGEFVSLEDLMASAVALARRDASVALTQGMQVWFWLAWLAGTPEQQALSCNILRDNGAPCLGVSEAEHGADLLAIETVAERTATGFKLTGRKWPIGRASDARVGFILARLRPEYGPRSLSWFLVDLEHPGVTRLPKVPTAGLRASDLSGLQLTNVPAQLVGREGDGLELTLKLFQITRPLMASLGLGMTDTALQTATRFALGRSLYRKRATDIAAVRRTLAAAWLDLLAAEMLLLSTVRALHVAPDQMSVASPLAKAIVPWLLGRTLQGATAVLGARSFLRTGDTGIFHKVLADSQAVFLIDGSTPVCLHALGAELPLLASRNQAANGSLRSRLRLSEPLPPFAPDRLVLTARGVDDITAKMPTELAWALSRLSLLGDVSSETTRLDRAHEFGLLHAAACCLHFQHLNPNLSLCRDGLPRLAALHIVRPERLDTRDFEHVFSHLSALVQSQQPLSIVIRPEPPAGEKAS